MVKQDFRGTSQTIIGKPIGLIRIGTIKKFYEDTLSVDVEIDTVLHGVDTIRNAQLPVSFYGIGGVFIGGYPEVGTPVIIAQGEGNSWFIVGFLPRDPSAQNTFSIPDFPILKKGTLTLQTDDSNKLEISKNGITIGDVNNSVTHDPFRSIYSNTFDNILNFTEASREITGIIKRDKKPNLNFASSLRLSSHIYDDFLYTISMDPLIRENHSNESSSTKNPAFAEKRELIYEFADSYKVLSDIEELSSYSGNEDKTIDVNKLIRRDSRTDTLSLSQIFPNHLMEITKGTVVDIYGNILDLNRSIIEIGKLDNLSLKNIKTTSKTDDTKNVFRSIKRAERKGIAYHFEINAKKEFSSKDNSVNVDDTSNYTRKRSRFFLDIDKEGQLKLNVPSSSETGNIPLLVRYENYSTISSNNLKNQKYLLFNEDNKDIFLESFISTLNPENNDINTGVISIIDEFGNEVSPIDRFSSKDRQKHIKHGTAYHNILKTCLSFQDNSYVIEYKKTTNIALGRIDPKKNIVSDKIIISGDNANAGGRSGSINFDGSLELNIGANTVDRQSIWLDTQGGIVGNVGRDLRNISAALSFDGEILIQSGGTTPSKDNRFSVETAKHISGAVDIRVFNQNSSKKEVTVFRIDNEGVTMTTPSRIVFYSCGDMILRSSATMNIEAEVVNIQGRTVIKDRNSGSI